MAHRALKWNRCGSAPLKDYRFGGAILREAIAPAFGLIFSPAIWNAGFVVQEPEIFLLVTLAKEDMNEDHRYVDHFVSDREFAWQSQGGTKQESEAWAAPPQSQCAGTTGSLLHSTNQENGLKANALCLLGGEVDFISWEGEAPISIRWQLRTAVPANLHRVLSVPSP